MENHFSEPFVKNSVRVALILLSLTLVTRLPFLLIKHLPYDIESYQIVAQILRDGKSVYQETTRYNYPPLWFWIIRAADLTSQKLYISLHTGIKLLIFLFEFLNSFLIYLAAQKLNSPKTSALVAAFGYALNPIPILVSGYYGQFDTIMIFWLLLAWYFFNFAQEKRRLYLSAISLSISIWLKLVPVFLLPVFLLKIKSWKDKVFYTTVSLLPTSLSLIAYWLRSPQGIINNVFRYSGVPYWWGYSFIFYALKEAFPSIYLLHQLNSFFTTYGSFIILGAIVIVYAFLYTLGTRRLLGAITIIFLSIYATTTGFGAQWLVWIIPFALLERDPPSPLRLRSEPWRVILFTIFGTLYISTSFIREFVSFGILQFLFDRYTWNVLARTLSLPLWIFCLWWLFSKWNFSQPCDKLES